MFECDVIYTVTKMYFLAKLCLIASPVKHAFQRGPVHGVDVQECNISSALAMEILQSCSKPSI